MRTKLSLTLLTLLFLPLPLVYSVSAEDTISTVPSTEITVTAAPVISPSIARERRGDGNAQDKVPEAIISMRAKIKDEREQIMKDLKSKMTASHEAIRAEIMKIRDQRKQQTVERINAHIAEKNKKMTDDFTRMLGIMTKQLTELQSNVDTRKKAEADLTRYNAAAAKAKTSVETAQKAVDTQAAKIYTITIQSDQTVKTDVSSVVTQLKADLKGVLSLVRAAREHVINTRKEARIIIEPKISVSPKPSEIPNISESPEPSLSVTATQ